jgi:hypothetical protein
MRSETINRSESIKEISVALNKFNEEISRISKDAVNPHFRNKYATLDKIIDEIRPILSKHGLSVIQFPSGDGERLSLSTMLLHTSGEYIESPPLIMKPVKNDPQGIGSCTTYARRYGICAVLNLNTGEDDDGNAASNPNKEATKSSLATVKAKYQLGKGNLDGFDDWVKKMMLEGHSYSSLDEILTKKLGEGKNK